MLEQERMRPAALRDIQLIETIAALNRKNLPERVMHAKGVGAKGYFQVYMPLEDDTCAQFLGDPELLTPVFVRFSTTTGARGSADTSRDDRGFAVKFYTEEGNYDLLSTSLPVRWINGPQAIPRLIAAFSAHPKSNLVTAEQFWRFVAETPEAVHKTLWLFSDRGTIKSYRHMRGYSSGTYVWVNGGGRRKLVRYRWEPLAGAKEINRQEAEFLAGFDPDAACRDLYDTLEQGETVEYELRVQSVPYEDRNDYGFDLENGTLIWPEDRIPVRPIGKLTLTENPQSAGEETEKAAFCPGTLVSGIELSGDPLLPAAIFACRDAQRHRLGGEAENAEVNRPRPQALVKGMAGGLRLERCVEWGEGAAYESGADREAEPETETAFEQAGAFYRNLSGREQDHLIGNLLDHMLFVEDKIKAQVVRHFAKADSDLGAGLTKSMDF